ncbi:MAG TPA: response regulator [Chloroflexia bacterium]|nr:response regulator [Chloroflexia bacterium]
MDTVAPHSPPPVLLVVEDNLEQRALLREFLPEIVRCDLREAADGVSALAEAQACRPSLVLLDLHIPPRGGIDLLHTLRADAALASVPVIILSGSRLAADLERVAQAGVFRFIEKPYNLDDLETAVHAALDAP